MVLISFPLTVPKIPPRSPWRFSRLQQRMAQCEEGVFRARGAQGQELCSFTGQNTCLAIDNLSPNQQFPGRSSHYETFFLL